MIRLWPDHSFVNGWDHCPVRFKMGVVVSCAIMYLRTTKRVSPVVLMEWAGFVTLPRTLPSY